MAKLWAFGDSFTFGSGLCGYLPDDTHWYKDAFSEYIFPELISNHLNLELKNLGMPGESNTTIIRSVLRSLPDIQTQDVVIIGLSCAARLSVPTGKGSSFVVSGDVLLSIIKAIRTKQPVPPWANRLIATYTLDELHTILDYSLTIMPRFYDDAYKEHLEAMSSLQKSFLDREIPCLVWDRTTWESFENIENWTRELGERQVYDGHWSPNGHLKFAEIVKLSLLDLSIKNPILINDVHIKSTIKRNPQIFKHINYIEPSIPIKITSNLI